MISKARKKLAGSNNNNDKDNTNFNNYKLESGFSKRKVAQNQNNFMEGTKYIISDYRCIIGCSGQTVLFYYNVLFLQNITTVIANIILSDSNGATRINKKGIYIWVHIRINVFMVFP